MYTIEEFKQNIGAVTRPTHFLVNLTFPTGTPENHRFMCKGAQLPTRTIGVRELSFFGRKVKVAGDTVFEPWTVTAYNDVAFTIRRKLEDWAEIINEARSNKGEVIPENMKTDLLITRFDEQMNVIKEYLMVGSWPSTPGDATELGWDTNDTAEEFTITFEYDYWTSDTSK